MSILCPPGAYFLSICSMQPLLNSQLVQMSDRAILPRCHNSSIVTVAFGGKIDMSDGNFRYLGLVGKFAFNYIDKRETLQVFEQKSDMGPTFKNQSGSDM